MSLRAAFRNLLFRTAYTGIGVPPLRTVRYCTTKVTVELRVVVTPLAVAVPAIVTT
jgi:hypothetical protein